MAVPTGGSFSGAEVIKTQRRAAQRAVQQVYRVRAVGAAHPGRRVGTDPLLSGVANAITAYRPDITAVRPRRPGWSFAGVESRNRLTWRTSLAVAAALGLDPTEFPSHHAGFLGRGFGRPANPEAFVMRPRDLLADG